MRPDFLVLTGNDLAIDQVIYGSDYLLGLSTFAPDAFAARDRAWAAGDELRFWALNDLLQYLGQLAFRRPVPGYRHDAAMFLRSARPDRRVDATPPPARRRGVPQSDRGGSLAEIDWSGSRRCSPEASAGGALGQDDLVEQGEGLLGDDGPGLLDLDGCGWRPSAASTCSMVRASSAAVTDAAVWPHGMPAGPSSSVEVAPVRHEGAEAEPDDVGGDAGGQHLAVGVERQGQQVAGGEPSGVGVDVDHLVGLGDRDAGVVGRLVVGAERPAHDLEVVAVATRPHPRGTPGTCFSARGAPSRPMRDGSGGRPSSASSSTRGRSAAAACSGPKWPWGITT